MHLHVRQSFPWVQNPRTGSQATQAKTLIHENTRLTHLNTSAETRYFLRQRWRQDLKRVNWNKVNVSKGTKPGWKIFVHRFGMQASSETQGQSVGSGEKARRKSLQFSSTGWIISSRRVSRPDWLSLGLRGWMQDAQMQLYWELKKKAFSSQACMAWHYQICIAKFQYSNRDDLPGKWGKNTAQECKRPFLVDGRLLKKVGTVARTLSCWFRWTSVTTGGPSSVHELPRVSILFCILRTIYRLWGLCMKNLI